MSVAEWEQKVLGYAAVHRSISVALGTFAMVGVGATLIMNIIQFLMIMLRERLRSLFRLR